MEGLSGSVQEFLRRRLNSVEQLAVLALLREDPAREWTIEEIARELRSTETAIKQRLGDLEALRVIATPPSGRYGWALLTPEMAEDVTAVLDAYRRRPDRVIETIYTKPPDALLAFADAFRLKKEKP